MKKINCVLVYIFVFSLVIFSGLFASCKIEENDENRPTGAPSVDKMDDEKGFIISAFNPAVDVKNIKYVNFYRQDVTEKNNPGEIVNIGLIYPEQFGPHGWVYQDYYVYSNRKYRYSVKYTTIDEVVSSAWNENDNRITNGYVNETNFSYTVPEECYFEYDNDDYTITLRGADITTDKIPVPILEKSRPYLVVSNGKEKKIYAFRDVKAETPNLEQGSVMWLRSIVEPEFTNVPISIEGVVFGQEIFKEDTETEQKTLTRVIYGMISKRITLKDHADQTLGKITIKPTTIDGGYDYSD